MKLWVFPRRHLLFSQSSLYYITEAGPADKAFAAFSLLNMIIYFVWAIILVVHRRTVMISRQELEASTAKEFSAYDGSGEIYNPTIGAAQGEDFGGDQEQL